MSTVISAGSLSSIGPSSTSALAAMAVRVRGPTAGEPPAPVRGWRARRRYPRRTTGSAGPDIPRSSVLATGGPADRPRCNTEPWQRGSPQPLEQAASPAEQIQRTTSSGQPLRFPGRAKDLPGVSVVSAFRQEMTVVQIIGHGMAQVNATGGGREPAWGARSASEGVIMPAPRSAWYLEIGNRRRDRSGVWTRKEP